MYSRISWFFCEHLPFYDFFWRLWQVLLSILWRLPVLVHTAVLRLTNWRLVDISDHIGGKHIKYDMTNVWPLDICLNHCIDKQGNTNKRDDVHIVRHLAMTYFALKKRAEDEEFRFNNTWG